MFLASGKCVLLNPRDIYFKKKKKNLIQVDFVLKTKTAEWMNQTVRWIPCCDFGFLIWIYEPISVGLGMGCPRLILNQPPITFSLFFTLFRIIKPIYFVFDHDG